MRMLTLLALFGALAFVNVRGVRAGTRVIETMTVAKLAPLLVLVMAGAFFIDGRALAWPGWPGNDAAGRSILLLIFAYSGVEVAIAPSGEVRGPAHTIPRAVFLARRAGIDAVGLAADIHPARVRAGDHMREAVATLLAVVDSYVLRRQPRDLEPPRPPTGPAR